MTELQFYKSNQRIIKVPAFYIVEKGKIILDREEIKNAFWQELDRVAKLAKEVKA